MEALATVDQAREEIKKEMTKKMLLDNVDINLISKYTNLSVEEIKALKK